MNRAEKITTSQIRYILCINRLSEGGCGVKNVEIATALMVSKPSVHNMLKSLAEIGVVEQESFGLAHFTELGKRLAGIYSVCYEKLELKMSELCAKGVTSEAAICAVLAEMTTEDLYELYKK